MNFKIKFLSIILFIGFISNKEVKGQVFSDVQKFFQESVFKPIQQTVREGVQEISGVISHITKGSSETDTTTNSSTNINNTLSTLIPSSSTEQPVNSNAPQNEESITQSSSTRTTEASTTEDSTSTTTTVVYESITSTFKPARSDVDLTPEDIAKLRELCPELGHLDDEQILDYRYFESKQACFRYGFQSKCGKGMKFYIMKPGSIYGECECKVDDRIFIYNEESNACYKIFTQGYCPEGQWVDLTREGQPICQPNPCFTPGKDMVQIKGKCAEVGQASEVCGDDEYVAFIKDKRNAVCKSSKIPDGTIGVPAIPCKPGNSIAIHGKCHVSDWDFGDEGEEKKKG